MEKSHLKMTLKRIKYYLQYPSTFDPFFHPAFLICKLSSPDFLLCSCQHYYDHQLKALQSLNWFWSISLCKSIWLNFVSGISQVYNSYWTITDNISNGKRQSATVPDNQFLSLSLSSVLWHCVFWSLHPSLSSFSWHNLSLALSHWLIPRGCSLMLFKPHPPTIAWG